MKYRAEIDGLRAVAILPVILFHANFGLFKGGFVGVDIFFVISGFLITSILIADLEIGEFSILQFYERRARRVLPALFVVIFVTFLFAWLWILPPDMASLSRSAASVVFFSSNIFFWLENHGYFDLRSELKPLLHTWSLGVEEQFYLFFPVFLALAWRVGKKRLLYLMIAVAALSLALAQFEAERHRYANFFLLPTRGWELLIGSAAALYLSAFGRVNFSSKHANQQLSLVGAALIVYSIFRLDDTVPFPSVWAVLPTAGAVLIILFAAPETLVGRLLGSKPFVGIGLISYSAYLWHQPVFALARHVSLTEPSAALYLALSAFSLLLAYITWRWIETPFRNRRFLQRREVFALSAAMSCALLAVGVVGHLTNGFSFRVSPEIRELAGLNGLHRQIRDKGGCNVGDAEFHLPRCLRGDAEAKPRFAVIGDSHAASLVDELSNAFASEHKSFVQYTKNDSPLAFGLTKRITENSDRFLNAAFEDIASDKFSVDTYIVASRWAYYATDDDFDNGEGGIDSRARDAYSIDTVGMAAPASQRHAAILASYKSTIEQLLKLGKKVVLVYPVPEIGWNVPIYTAKTGKFDASVSYSAFLKRNEKVIALFDSFGDSDRLLRVKPSDRLCNTFVRERCVAMMGRTPLYFDTNHLTNAGARLVVEQIMAKIEETQAASLEPRLMSGAGSSGAPLWRDPAPLRR